LLTSRLVRLGVTARLLRRLPVTNAALRMSRPISVAIRVWRFLRIGAIPGVDTEQGFDASNDAADRAANDGPDRTRTSVALIHPVRDAAGNALSLGCHRQSDGCCDDACKQYVELHCVILPFVEMQLPTRQ
jgi:hypothetical protein